MDSLSIRLLAGTLSLAVDRRESEKPLLLLHGGAGPASMRPLFNALDEFGVVLPIHPGFDATERPPWMASIVDLAECYIELLSALKLQDVVVVGNSVGGWIAAEMAARRPSSLAGVVLVNAVGLKPTENTGPIVDPRSMPPQELVKLSFADPSRALLPSRDAAEQRVANQRVLMTYAGEPFMYDAMLSERLANIDILSLVLWGRQDRIVTPEYGQDYARRIPGARFQMIDDAGHLPQIEQPLQTAQAIREFCAIRA